jgi:DNA-binding transcriptional regulator LsrR (DeoR family)
MGRTLHHVTQVSKEYDYDKQDLLFVPMYGGISQKRTGKMDVQSNRIAVEFAQKFGGDYVQFLAPAVFSSKKVKDIFLNEETIRYIYRYFTRCGIAFLELRSRKKTALFYVVI